MGTLVLFHAHPDDESISTGGSIARAVAEGHRVVLVVATDGRHGEVPDDLAAGLKELRIGKPVVDWYREEIEKLKAAGGAAIDGTPSVDWGMLEQEFLVPAALARA